MPVRIKREKITFISDAPSAADGLLLSCTFKLPGFRLLAFDSTADHGSSPLNFNYLPINITLVGELLIMDYYH